MPPLLPVNKDVAPEPRRCCLAAVSTPFSLASSRLLRSSASLCSRASFSAFLAALINLPSSAFGSFLISSFTTSGAVEVSLFTLSIASFGALSTCFEYFLGIFWMKTDFFGFA